MSGHPNIVLQITRSIAPRNKWHWSVVLPGGHVWKMSESFDSVEACADSASKKGVSELQMAEVVAFASWPINPSKEANDAEQQRRNERDRFMLDLIGEKS